MDAVAARIIDLKWKNCASKFLVFCESEEMKNQLLTLFLPGYYIDGFSSTAKGIKEFRGRWTPDVLILHIKDAEVASIWCLDTADHIMFVAPEVYKCMHTVTTIVSRACRDQQIQSMYIWHFLWARNLDLSLTRRVFGKNPSKEARLIGWQRYGIAGKEEERLALEPGSEKVSEAKFGEMETEERKEEMEDEIAMQDWIVI